MIYTLTLNPSLDQHFIVKKIIKDDVVYAQQSCLDPGGKGLNVTRVIQQLGGKSRAFTMAGGSCGKLLEEMLHQQSIHHRLYRIQGNTRTNIKITAHDGSHIQIQGQSPRLKAADIKPFFHMIEQVKPRPSYWVLAGSLPQGITPAIYAQLIQSFHKRGEKCVLDADAEPFQHGVLAKPFLIKPNEHELQRLMGKKLMTRNQMLKAARELTRKVDIVVVTLASKGALVVTPSESWHLTLPPVEVKSPVGAGDAFLGGFLFALDRKESLQDAARWAMAAATASVRRHGTANCRHSDVLALVKRVVLKKC
ncbi:MAG: 1-phosphofructokinase family hexose kinase [Candidatus Omnitrophica bacterium]|nr:1-phosphofructokinase family hexose kinase [Candidatus Omnitrophota bacterium]